MKSTPKRLKVMMGIAFSTLGMIVGFLIWDRFDYPIPDHDFFLLLPSGDEENTSTTTFSDPYGNPFGDSSPPQTKIESMVSDWRDSLLRWKSIRAERKKLSLIELEGTIFQFSTSNWKMNSDGELEMGTIGIIKFQSDGQILITGETFHSEIENKQFTKYKRRQADELIIYAEGKEMKLKLHTVLSRGIVFDAANSDDGFSATFSKIDHANP